MVMRKRLPMVYQSEMSECGLACLAMVGCYHGRSAELTHLRAQAPAGAGGLSLIAMTEIAARLDLHGRALRLEVDQLPDLQCPAILHWDMDHFVVLQKTGRRGATVHDPAIGIRQYPWPELSRHFTGVALELMPGRAQPAGATVTPRLCLGDLLPMSLLRRQGLGRVFALSLLLQLLMLASPLFLQLVIDHGISSGDQDFVLFLALVFFLLLLLRILLALVRGKYLLSISNRLSFVLVSELFRHLLRLPLAYFEHRELGDIVSRFTSVESIRQLLTQEMATLIIDGLFSLITLSLLFAYDPRLAAIVLLAVMLTASLRGLTLALEKERREESLVSGAAQQSRFMETIRHIASVKLNLMHSEREQSWQNRYVDHLNANYRLSDLQLQLGSAQAAFAGCENLLVVSLGSLAVINGNLSLGQLMAFMLLKQHFLSSFNAMLPKLAELRLIRLELERLAEIRLAAPEPDHRTLLYSLPCRGSIGVNRVAFSYGRGRPPVLRGISFMVPAGGSLGLAGPSGAGKTTLLKILLGLEAADSGEVLIDGDAVSDEMRPLLRQNLAAVMHGESLLAGDLGFNIHLGNASSDRDRLAQACAVAGLTEFVSSLPLGFATRVGELGSEFSAGQIQRILLARALYRRTSIVILDEGLAHLGFTASLHILEALKSRGITAIVVSHDRQLLAELDQLVELPAGAASH